MASLDYYAVLGVARDASDEDIKKAYRKLVFEFHPDRNPGNATADAKIREINAAYEVIGDPDKRRSYERLRFGEAQPFREETVPPDLVREAMEQKLYDEGQKELFAILIKQVKRIKEELAIVRERTVAAQGYDTFKEPIVLDRAAEILDEFVTPELDAKGRRLLDVALQMMVSQGVVTASDGKGSQELRTRFETVFRRGRLMGIRNAMELFYTRR